MRATVFLLSALLYAINVSGQTLSGNYLMTSLKGENFCIKTIEPNHSFALFSNNDTNHDSVITVFSSYKIIPFKNEKCAIVQLFYQFQDYEYSVEIFDLNSGVSILSRTSEDSIIIVYSEQVFIANNDNGKAKIVDHTGRVLFEQEKAFFTYSSTGFFNKRVDEIFHEEFLSKTGDILHSIPNYAIHEEVAAEAFVGVNQNYEIKLIDIENNILFEDECLFELIPLYTDRNNIPYLIAHGVCDLDDDVSILIKQKNGKWNNPLSKINKKYWVDYIRPLSYDFNITEINDYYIVADENGMIVDKKGRIVSIFEDDPRAIKYEKVDPFIFLTIDNSLDYLVYDSNGEIVIPNVKVHLLHINDQFPDIGFHIFINEIEKLAFIYNDENKKVVSIALDKMNFNSRNELEKLYLSGDDILKY